MNRTELLKTAKPILFNTDMVRAIDRLAEICEAECEGRLVVLPCKVGDTVYVRGESFPCEIEQITITEDYINFEWASFDRSYECTECWDEGVFKLSDIGKTVFLTREEAEKALAEMEENNG